jgi:succinate-acetate transporter protein
MAVQRIDCSALVCFRPAFSSFGGFWMSVAIYSILSASGLPWDAAAPKGREMTLALWVYLRPHTTCHTRF